jgi:SAM-dependent methyltransferase
LPSERDDVSLAQQPELGRRNGEGAVTLPPEADGPPDTGGARAQSIANARQLLVVAEERSAARTRWPAKLDRFPFTLFRWLERFSLRVLAYVFKDQRQVNAALIGATRELADAVRAESAARADLARALNRLTARLIGPDDVAARMPADDFAELVEGHQRVVNQLVDALSREVLEVEERQARADEAATAARRDLDTVKAGLQDAVDFTATSAQSLRADVERVRRDVQQHANAAAERAGAAESAVHDVERLHADTAQRLDEVAGRVVSEALPAMSAALADATGRFERELAGVSERVAALAGLTAHPSHELQITLADTFRGAEDDVKHRLSAYLPYLAALGAGAERRSVLDIGAGRGEWLELLRDNGYGGFGIDTNDTLVSRAKSKGLDVVGGDARRVLRELADRSLQCITAFHVVEHLPFDDLIRLLDECRRLLVPGGLLIFETPNPENVVVGTANFYLDPTHIRPYPMALLRMLVEQRGFASVETLPLNPNVAARSGDGTEIARRFNDFFYGAMDYGVIARCP